MLELRTVIAEEERLLEAAADATPLAQLKMAMRLFLRISWNHPALGRIVALEGMAGGERLAWLDSHLIGPRNRRLTEMVSAAIAADALKAFPPAQVVVTLQAAAAGIINLAPLMQASFGVDCDCAEARDAHERLIVDAFIGGLVKPTIERRNRRPREGSHGTTP
jgi:hypothetical protein